MHINWRIPLGGSLQGVLPLPGLSAEAFIQAQVFGRKQVAQVALEDAQGIEVGQVFGKHAPVLMQRLPDDAQTINAVRVFTMQSTAQQGMSPGWLMAFAASC